MLLRCFRGVGVSYYYELHHFIDFTTEQFAAEMKATRF